MQVGGYELLSELGRGGMGTVHRARAADGRIVALKMLRAGADADAVAAFEREKRLVFSFSEADGFVPVLDASASPPFIVMPLVEGGTLAGRLAAGPLSVADAVALATQLAKALGRAHERGVVHRDLKPANVLFTKDGRPLVADLGLAKHFRRDVLGASRSASYSTTGTIAGTPGYMAREQLEDATRVGPPADVFALGVILHEALAGARPFEGTTLLEYAESLARRSPPPLRRLRPDVPAWLERVVLRALASDPRERHPDGHALARALEQGRAAPGRAWPLGVAGAALVAVVLAGSLAVASRSPASPAPTPPVPASPRSTATPAPPSPPAISPAVREEEDRAEVAIHERRYKDAIAHYTRALEHEPRNEALLRKRACLHNCLSEFSEARQDADAALALEPDDAEVYAERAYAEGFDDREASLRDIEKAYALDRDDNRVRFVHGLVMKGLRRDAEAEADFDYVIEREVNTLALMNRAEIREGRGDLDGALADHARAIATDPNAPLYYRARALCLARHDRFAEAAADARRFLELTSPQDPSADVMRQIILRAHPPGGR